MTTPTTAVERIIGLAMLLLSRREPVSSQELFEAFPDAYAGSAEARLRKLGRDMEELRQLGIPVEWRDDDEEKGYRVDRRATFLPPLQLTDPESAALFAVGSAALRARLPLSNDLSHALLKLRARLGESRTRPDPSHLYLASREDPACVPLLLETVASRQRVTLTYGGSSEERIVSPYGVARRRGRSYLIGHCHRREAVRVFATDRIGRCVRTTPDGRRPEFETPHDFDAGRHLPHHAWQMHVHAPVTVTLSFHGTGADEARRALGWTTPTGDVTHLDGLLSQLLSLWPAVRLEAPTEARARLRELLQPLVEETL